MAAVITLGYEGEIFGVGIFLVTKPRDFIDWDRKRATKESSEEEGT